MTGFAPVPTGGDKATSTKPRTLAQYFSPRCVTYLKYWFHLPDRQNPSLQSSLRPGVALGVWVPFRSFCQFTRFFAQQTTKNMLSYTWILAALTAVAAVNAFSASDLSLSKDSITLSSAFTYAVSGYDIRPHHARTPFAVGAGNGNAYVAYLAGSTVYVQQVDHANGFVAIGNAVTVPGLVAGGLVAHDDGFALLTTRKDGTTANGEPTAYIVRYTNGKESWATPLVSQLFATCFITQTDIERLEWPKCGR
jgi:hypothetical protein